MRAGCGENGSRDPLSVSPSNIVGEEEEADDEHAQGDPTGIDCERLALAKEGGMWREYWILHCLVKPMWRNIG